MPADCVPWKYFFFHVCTHLPHPALDFMPFQAPCVSLFPDLPFRSLIKLAALKARLLISSKPLQGQHTHCFFVNCLQKWQVFPAFTGSNVLKPDFPESTTWSCCIVCRAAGTDMDFVFICPILFLITSLTVILMHLEKSRIRKHIWTFFSWVTLYSEAVLYVM